MKDGQIVRWTCRDCGNEWKEPSVRMEGGQGWVTCEGGHRKRYSGPDQSSGDKGMRSIEWMSIKGHENAIPWPCPMEISPIYVYSP